MTVNLLFTVDIDNDGNALAHERNVLSWRALERLPDIKSVFQKIGAPVTWFVRADNQLQEIYGSAAYILAAHAALWRDLVNTDDEIAWHPHLYEWDENVNKYVLDSSEERCADKLRAIHAELVSTGASFESVRIGEAFHGNELMRALADLGLKIDSTAIPGRRRADAGRTFDWSPTPNEPYYPSVSDYRVPNSMGAHLSILEVPMTTMPVQAQYDVSPFTRYINLTYHHQIFKTGFDQLMTHAHRNRRKEIFINTIMHPEEVLEPKKANGLYSHSLSEMQRNLQHVLRVASTPGNGVRFLRICDTIC